MRTKLRQLCVLLVVAGAGACSLNDSSSDAATAPPTDTGTNNDVATAPPTDTGTSSDAATVPACPPDLTAPIAMVTCTTDQEPIDGKISAAHRVWFETMSGAMTVIIGAEGGAKVCPLPDCSVRPCAERDAFLDRWQAENLASQRCIRDLIVSIGGTADATAFLGNSFAAMLTWEQIQVVAAHPHVTSVEANIPTPPP